MMREAKAAERLEAEGLPHAGFDIAVDGALHHIDLKGLTGGKTVTVYGQTELTRDLMDKRAGDGVTTIYDAQNVTPFDFDGDRPWVSYEKDGVPGRIDADFIIGCDGFHGVSRKSAPSRAIETFERIYPFGCWACWRMCRRPARNWSMPTQPGFTLCSMRSKTAAATTFRSPLPIR